MLASNEGKLSATFFVTHLVVLALWARRLACQGRSRSARLTPGSPPVPNSLSSQDREASESCGVFPLARIDHLLPGLGHELAVQIWYGWPERLLISSASSSGPSLSPRPANRWSPSRHTLAAASSFDGNLAIAPCWSHLAGLA